MLGPHEATRELAVKTMGKAANTNFRRTKRPAPFHSGSAQNPQMGSRDLTHHCPVGHIFPMLGPGQTPLPHVCLGSRPPLPPRPLHSLPEAPDSSLREASTQLPSAWPPFSTAQRWGPSLLLAWYVHFWAQPSTGAGCTLAAS